MRPLFADRIAEGVRYYRKTGTVSDQSRHGDQARDRASGIRG